MARLNTRYTVLLLYPHWLEGSVGIQTFTAHVRVRDPVAAVAAAKRQAVDANKPNELVARDFRTLLVFEGHHVDLKPDE